MSDLNKADQRTKTTTLLIVFTAIYIVLRFFPYSIMIGGSGVLSLSDLLPPIFGIMLGPYAGGIGIILGNLAAMGFGRPPTFFGLDFLPDLLAVVAIGLLVRRRWTPVIGLYSTLFLIFLVNPLTSIFVFSFPFAWLHIATFIVLLSPLGRSAGQWIEAPNSKRVTTGLAILALIGTMIQHLTGSILFEILLGQLTSSVPATAYPGIWASVFFVYPVERLILVVSAVLVGMPIIWILNNMSFLRPRSNN